MATSPSLRGRASVRRRALGLTHSEVRSALEDARVDYFGAQGDEPVRDGGHGAAALAEWERIERLLAGTTAVYTPDSDPLVREERAAGHRHEEAARPGRAVGHPAVSRKDMMDRQLGLHEAMVASVTGVEDPRPPDAPGRTRRRDRIDAWLALALSDHGGFPVPAGPPSPASARAALLAALARAGAPADAHALPFVGRLADADAAAVVALAAWFDGVLPSVSTGGETAEREDPGAQP
ncbi:hypothetical protein ACFYY2_09955 [Streptomyces sp. NPDC001822]|uniref:hypothetical protein n=1 Tax=Streptomyces sp. NPDC001822 TaxID=3364614 RepID=UPI003694F2D4